MYFNPAITSVLRTVEYNEGTVISASESCFTIYYPLDKKIEDIEEVNNRLRVSHCQLVEVAVEDQGLPQGIELDAAKTIIETIEKLKSRLDISRAPRSPKYAVVTLDDAEDWIYTY